MMEVGVASPMAQGQAMISTATALTSASLRPASGASVSQAKKVTSAMAMTAGTKYPVTRSTRDWMGSLAP